MIVADLRAVVPRMRLAHVDSIAIFVTDSGQIIVRATGRWGCTTFSGLDDFGQWLATGQLPAGAQTKFAPFNPRLPN